MKNKYCSPFPKWRLESDIDDVILSLSDGTYMPSIEDYKNTGQLYCYNAIIDYPTGQNYFAEKLGLKFRHMPRGWWKNEASVISSILSISKDGYMQLKREFDDNGLSACYNAMSKYHPGRIYFASKLNLKLHRVPAGYYNEKKRIKQVVQGNSQNGRYPTERTLQNNGHGGLYIKILEIFGSARACADYCGLQVVNHENKYWKSKNNVQKKLEDISQGYNKITAKLLRDKNCHGLLSALSLYHNGIYPFAEELGKESGRKPPWYYESLDIVRKEMLKFVEGTWFPTKGMFMEAGKLGLYRGILRYYKGKQYIVSMLGLSISSDSAPEMIIAKILNQHQLQYKRNQTFSGCKYIMPLRFDFYLNDYNTAIEYNGEQHYKPVAHWGGQEELINQQIRDRIKIEYCSKNKIRLIIIPFHIESLTYELLRIIDILKKEI